MGFSCLGFFSCKQQPGKLTDSPDTGNISKQEECNIRIHRIDYRSTEEAEDIFLWKNGNWDLQSCLEEKSILEVTQPHILSFLKTQNSLKRRIKLADFQSCASQLVKGRDMCDIKNVHREEMQLPKVTEGAISRRTRNHCWANRSSKCLPQMPTGKAYEFYSNCILNAYLCKKSPVNNE